MQADHHLIPNEALPPGWGPAVTRSDRLVYRRHHPTLELVAEQTDPDQAHPTLGIGWCWELQYHHYIGELPIRETVGHLPTRRAAIEGLLECMHRIHERAEEPADPLSVQAALADVPLDGELPSRGSSGPIRSSTNRGRDLD